MCQHHLVHNHVMGQCSQLLQVTSLDPKSAPPRRLTRPLLEQRGDSIASVAANGDFIAVQLFNKPSPFMIARVQGGSYRALSANQTCWLGTIPQGSKVIDCHLHEPIAPGSNHYQACKTADDKAYITTPVLVQDIRMGPHKDEHSGAIIGKLELQEVELRAIRNSSKRYAMSTELKQDVLASLIQDDSLVGERVEQLQSVDDSSVLF